MGTKTMNNIKLIKKVNMLRLLADELLAGRKDRDYVFIKFEDDGSYSYLFEASQE